MEELNKIALEFAASLKNEKFVKAHSFMAMPYKLIWSPKSLKDEYISMISYGEGPTLQLNIEISDDMSDWMEKREEDIGWVYVSMSGDEFSEAVALTFINEKDTPKIKYIEWGRP